MRGQFDAVPAEVRARLEAEAAEHDELSSAFTEEGSFVYDLRYGAFSFRYAMRTTADDRQAAHDEAVATGLAKAAASLEAQGITAKRLRVTATNMAEVWERPSGNRSGPRRRGTA